MGQIHRHGINPHGINPRGKNPPAQARGGGRPPAQARGRGGAPLKAHSPWRAWLGLLLIAQLAAPFSAPFFTLWPRPVAAQDAIFDIPAALSSQQGAANIGRLYREGLGHWRRNELAAAEATWQALLRRDPNHFSARLGLGKLLLRDDPERARPHLERAVDLRPASDAARFHLGRYLESRNRLLDAAEEYRKAIKLNARHYDANARLRKVIRKLRSRQSVVERAAEQFWVKPNLASLTLFGRMVMRHSEPRQALLEFELVGQRLPDMPEVQLWIARAERQLGSLQGEIAAYGAYLEKNKNAVGVRLLMLDRLLEAGQFRSASGPLAELEKQRLDRGNQGRFLYLKSQFLVAQGEAGQASAALLASAAQGFDPGKLEPAFRNNVTRFPEQPRLWLDYGTWLKQQGREEPAVEAYYNAANTANAAKLVKGAQPAKQDQSVAGEALDALREFADREPGVVAANLALGELALARGEQATAIARLERIPPGHQQDGRAALLLGAVYRSRGDLDKALDAFTRYVFSFPDRPGMAFARGNLFWVIGKHDIAVGRWAADLESIKGHPEALLLMAGHYQKLGDGVRELAMREHLRAAAPENLTNLIRLGDLLLAQGNRDAAAREWERAAQLKTGDFALLVRLGSALLELGEQDRGISALRRAAQIGDLEAPLAEKLARQLMARKRYAEALEFYWQIYRTRPNHPDLPKVLPQLVAYAPARPEQSLAAARYAEASAQSELAIELLEELLRLHPLQGEARIMLARLYMAGGEPAEAERTLTQGGGVAGVSEIKSLRPLAQLQRLLRNRAGLAKTLARMLELEPGQGAATRELALLLMELKRPKAASVHLSATLKSNPKDTEALYQLASAELQLKRFPQSEANLTRLLELKPEDKEGQRLYIQILREGKRWQPLTQRLESFLSQYPDDPDARYSLISAYLNLFDTEKARPHYEKLKASHPAMVRALHSYF